MFLWVTWSRSYEKNGWFRSRSLKKAAYLQKEKLENGLETVKNQFCIKNLSCAAVNFKKYSFTIWFNLIYNGR